MTFRTWHFKGEKKMTSLHSYPKRSIPKTLFGTLTNLLLDAQKQLSVRTLIIQKPVKWFEIQNSWLVSKRSTFLVKGISKQTWTHFQSIFHLWTNQVVGWKSYILTKDSSEWHASLFKKFSMGIFSHIFLVKTIWFLDTWNIGTLSGNELKTVRF